jgi:U3 small nucleolar RNA-associated protein 22
MLSLHIKEELMELLAIRAFMQPYPWRVPSSARAGFLRTLAWIGRWDWRTQPLIVDFSGTLDAKDVSTVNTRLEAWRKIDPGMNREVVFAATNHDLTGTAFTDRGPSKVVAARMTALARGAWKVVKDTTDFEDFDVETLFVPSTQEYDFVIQLSSKFTGGQKGKKEAKSSQFKNLEVQSDEDAYLVGYEPVASYIDELKKVYGDSVVLFWNAAGGSVIGGLWNPATGGQRAFKVNAPFATKPLKDAQHVEIDKQSIVAEMARLGGDMVKNIDVRR